MKEINFKCAVPGCEKSALKTHAICDIHLACEFLITFAVLLSIVWGVIYIGMKLVGD